MITIDEYQEHAFKTAVYPHLLTNGEYPYIGLIGETGELAEHVKKIMRDDNGVITDARRAAMLKEAGDVLWYIAAIATENNAKMSEALESCAHYCGGLNFLSINDLIKKLAYYVGFCAEERFGWGRCAFTVGIICRRIGHTLEDAMVLNLQKLAKRRDEGTIKGEGSDR